MTTRNSKCSEHPWRAIKYCDHATPEQRTAIAGRGPGDEPDMTPHRKAAEGRGKPRHFLAMLRRNGIPVPTDVPTNERGQRDASTKLGPNDPCNCEYVQRGQLEPHKAKRHSFLAEPLVAEERATARAAVEAAEAEAKASEEAASKTILAAAAEEVATDAPGTASVGAGEVV